MMALALALVLSMALAMAMALALALAIAKALALTMAMDLAMALALAMDLDLDLALDLSMALAMALALALTMANKTVKRNRMGNKMGLPKFSYMYRMSRDPELSYSQSGVAICRVGLACSEKYGEKETQLFIDGTAFKKTGEMLATVQKGHRVLVTGKLETQQWQDQQSGQNRSKICMLIESFEFIEPKQNNQQQQQSGFQQPQQYTGSQQPMAGNQGFQQQGQPDDDVPF